MARDASDSAVAEALAANRAEVARALDPLCEGGAVARFLGKLQERYGYSRDIAEQKLTDFAV